MSIPENTLSTLISPLVSFEQLKITTPLKLGILASGSGSNFGAIAAAIAHGELNAQIQVLIYNNPDAYVYERAQHWGVKAILLNHRDFKTREALDQAIIEVLQEYQVDIVIMAGWMRVVSQTLIDAYPHKLINIHPSLLPSFRGLRAIEQALASGVKITGCTVHLVSLEVDSGEILLQAAVPVLEDDTPSSLHARIQIQEHKILPQAIALAAMRNQQSKKE